MIDLDQALHDSVSTPDRTIALMFLQKSDELVGEALQSLCNCVHATVRVVGKREAAGEC